MKVGVFDSGLGGLTVVNAIAEVFSGADIFYIADTKSAPYGEKSQEEISKRSIAITEFLINKYQISALIVACNTATSASIKILREKFSNLIVIGTEPGLKPAIENTKTRKIGVLATPATLNGDKYQILLNELSMNSKVEVYEQACAGLVEQIENDKIKDIKTFHMLEAWLKPMIEKEVDTIVLGCTHYPLVSSVIKEIMGTNTKLIETGSAIAKRLEDLSMKNGHKNNGDLNITVFYTGEIKLKMIDMILKNWKNGGKVCIKDLHE